MRRQRRRQLSLVAQLPNHLLQPAFHLYALFREVRHKGLAGVGASTQHLLQQRARGRHGSHCLVGVLWQLHATRRRRNQRRCSRRLSWWHRRGRSRRTHTCLAAWRTRRSHSSRLAWRNGSATATRLPRGFTHRPGLRVHLRHCRLHCCTVLLTHASKRVGAGTADCDRWQRCHRAQWHHRWRGVCRGRGQDGRLLIWRPRWEVHSMLQQHFIRVAELLLRQNLCVVLDHAENLVAYLSVDPFNACVGRHLCHFHPHLRLCQHAIDHLVAVLDACFQDRQRQLLHLSVVLDNDEA
mmetsp:Transcript_23478/g.69761  ORF Transcript_23478/g.69761 Transcript_23478/m.69761 type:complete len:295 (-) Transcript_23478:254-1138(-)